MKPRAQILGREAFGCINSMHDKRSINFTVASCTWQTNFKLRNTSLQLFVSGGVWSLWESNFDVVIDCMTRIFCDFAILKLRQIASAQFYRFKSHINYFYSILRPLLFVIALHNTSNWMKRPVSAVSLLAAHTRTKNFLTLVNYSTFLTLIFLLLLAVQ